MTFGESTAVLLLGVGSSVGLYVLGQNDSGLPQELTTLAPAALGSGFLIWYARHVTANVIPQLVKDHKAEVNELVRRHEENMMAATIAHKETVVKLVDDFRSENQQLREDHEKNISRVLSLAQPGGPADAMRPANH